MYFLVERSGVVRAYRRGCSVQFGRLLPQLSNIAIHPAFPPVAPRFIGLGVLVVVNMTHQLHLLEAVQCCFHASISARAPIAPISIKGLRAITLLCTYCTQPFDNSAYFVRWPPLSHSMRPYAYTPAHLYFSYYFTSPAACKMALPVSVTVSTLRDVPPVFR